MKQLNKFSMQLLSRSANESFARVAVSAFVTQLDPTIEEINDIKTAVSEAVTNAIVHAYPATIGKVVLKARICSGNVLEISVKDHGKGIPDVEKARQPMYTTGGADRSGMGFTIMESFMTTLEITSAPGKGTTVHMRRKLLRRQ